MLVLGSSMGTYEWRRPSLRVLQVAHLAMTCGLGFKVEGSRVVRRNAPILLLCHKAK